MSHETRVIMNYQFNNCDIIGRGLTSIVYKGINIITEDQPLKLLIGSFFINCYLFKMKSKSYQNYRDSIYSNFMSILLL